VLVCKQCGSNRVFGIVPNALQLEVQLDRVGEVTERLLRESGIWEPSRGNNIRHMVVSEKVKYEDLSMETITQFVCKSCNHVAEIDGFDNINHCRCGARTDNVVLCERHLFIACGSCFDRKMCNDCTLNRCVLNPRNASGGYEEVFRNYREEETNKCEDEDDDFEVEAIAFVEDEPPLNEPRLVEYGTEPLRQPTTFSSDSVTLGIARATRREREAQRERESSEQ